MTITPDLALILAFFIIIASLFIVAALFSGRKEREQQEALQRAASARGWRFEAASARGYRTQRWTGVTDGIAWSAESLILASGGNKRGRRRHIARWHGAWNPGVSSPIVGMGLPKGKEQAGEAIAAGDGFFAKLAQKAVGLAFDKAIDAYFGHDAGKEVDASAMRRVDAKLPGFIIMANDPAEAAQVMQHGLESTLLAATNDRSSVLSHEDRPWLLIRPKGISLARMERFRDIAELDGFVRTGVALARSFKFGRPA